MEIEIPIYVEQNIFVELGLAALPTDRKEQMLSKMNELIHKRVMIRVLDQLPEDAKEQLNVSATGESAQDMDALVEQVPNLADIILDEITAVRGMMHASAAEIEKAQ